MPRKQQLELANFILRFGDSLVLLDLLEEIVIPAFKSDLERTTRQTRHVFHDVSILDLGNNEVPSPCIVGRYIKDTFVNREQTYNPRTKQLVHDKEFLQTSPSAVFILVLKNHRLLYFGETTYAPSLKTFKTTIERFLRDTHKAFVNEIYETQFSNSDRPKRTVTKEIQQEYPVPRLEIIPLASQATIREFVSQYDLLKTVEINLAPTNSEIDNDGLFRNLRKAQNKLGSKSTKLRHTNPTEGLDKEEVVQHVESAGKQASAHLKLIGNDPQGNRVEGSNEEFKIKVMLNDTSKNAKSIANEAVQKFKQLVEQGEIQIGIDEEDSLKKLNRINFEYDEE